MLAFNRLARTASKVRLMQQLYYAVAIPKMTYAVDIWYTPPHRKEGTKKDSGSVGITNKLVSLQQMAALAITGALCFTATDVLDLHAGTWPVRLLLHRSVTGPHLGLPHYWILILCTLFIAYAQGSTSRHIGRLYTNCL